MKYTLFGTNIQKTEYKHITIFTIRKSRNQELGQSYGLCLITLYSQVMSLMVIIRGQRRDKIKTPVKLAKAWSSIISRSAETDRLQFH